jgi:hypothetical protein
MNGATMTTTTLHPVDEFARAVRAALSDLPPDEIEDLTDGLEADLAERASDQDSPEFGDPLAYASELRSAAGLPPRAAKASRRIDGVIAATWHELRRGLRELNTHPLIARLAAFFVAIRPLWWAFRAWVFYCIVTWVLGVPTLTFNLATLMIGVGSLIVSVQFGRGKWQPRAWMRAALVAINVVLVLTVPVVLLATSFAFNSEVDNAFADGQSQSAQGTSGLQYNGRQISNIFAYDASGKPLTDVQLFDQSGKPLNAVPNSAQQLSDNPPYLVPNGSVVGRRGWNVYPLETIPASQIGNDGNPKPTAKPKPATPTFLIVPPLANSAPAMPTATPTPPPTSLPAP